MTAWLLSGLSLLILLLASEALLRSVVTLSLRLGVPVLIVSLTIVGFGTSAPELLIAISAIKENAPGIALGNAVGSNIANILLVLGLPALLATLDTSYCDSRSNYISVLVASVLFIGLAFRGVFDLISGAILLAALVLMLTNAFRGAQADRKACEEAWADENEFVDLEEANPQISYSKVAIYLILGLFGLPIGAHLLVENATIIARTYGVSESVIGLTLISVGTSLPELATAVMAALRRQVDVVLGNVIGSNMFNLLAVIGIATWFGPIPVDPEFLEFDLWVMLGASLLLVPFVFFRWDISRRWGLILTLLYVIYITSQLV